MGLFRKKGSKNSLVEEAVGQVQPAMPPPPPINDVLNAPNAVFCTIREPWQWMLEEALKDKVNLAIVPKASELPTGKRAADSDGIAMTPTSRRRRKKTPIDCALRLEVQDCDGALIYAVHASSEAFDGLEDKDELVRTMQRCRCEHLEISPASRLVNWDVTKDECKNVVGADMPTLSGGKGAKSVAVLKEPMGSRGTGIFFVRDAIEIHTIIEKHRKRAVEEPNFLDNLIASKGRIPSWVLQAEVRPCLLIRDRRKFHIRTYVVGVERWETDDLIDTHIYNRHEVRIASEPVPVEDGDTRDRAVHITNAASTLESERALLHEMPELQALQQALELFVAKVFAKHLINDISRRVGISASESVDSDAEKFALAGLDIMVTEDKRLYLLEVNVNPIIPPRAALRPRFEKHLIGFMSDLVDLVIGKPTSTFTSCHSVLQRN